MTETIASAASTAQPGTEQVTQVLSLTDEELAVLGAADDLGVLPFWEELTEAEQKMGTRTAFRGLIARGLIDMPTPDTVKAYLAQGPDAELSVMMRADLESLITLRKGAPAAIAIARTAALGQDFIYAHVVGDTALVEEVAHEGIHDFAVAEGPILGDLIANSVLHPEAADATSGEPIGFTSATEPPPALIDALGEAHLRSDVILRRAGDTAPPLLGVFSGPKGTWLVRAAEGVGGSATATPSTVAEARQTVLGLIDEARAAGKATPTS